jgi:hypothetical protein
MTVHEKKTQMAAISDMTQTWGIAWKKSKLQ